MSGTFSAVALLLLGLVSSPDTGTGQSEWLFAILNHENGGWYAATLPGETERASYASDVAFLEAQSYLVRAYIIQSMMDAPSEYLPTDVAHTAARIVGRVQASNPNASIVLPSVLHRADLDLSWLVDIKFSHGDYDPVYASRLIVAITLEVIDQEDKFIRTYRPNEQDNGYTDRDAEPGRVSDAVLPKTAFYRSDRIKKDLLDSVSRVAVVGGVDAGFITDITAAQNAGDAALQWATRLKESAPDE